MTYQEWLVGLGKYRTENPAQRAGQAAFNYLTLINMGIADKILLETNLDPFHPGSDETVNKIRLKRFFDYVEEHWED